MSLSNIKCLVRTNQTTKNQLKDIKDGSIIFEYAIPRIGRRIDNILLMNNKFCFCVLKKRGGRLKLITCTLLCKQRTYASDLTNFQKTNKIIPI